jgi:GMP synthase-like glutamine amidotransferase
MEVVVLQHADVEGPGRLAEVLDARGLGARVVRSDLGESLPRDAASLAGLVVMGGPMGVDDATRLPFLNAEISLLERAVAREVPTLGICLGSQLLAFALGARVHRGTAKEIGWLPVETYEAAKHDGLFQGAPRKFRPLHWHGDVFDLPHGATALARSEATPCQAYRAGPKAWGLLFHLEATREQVARMATAFDDELREAGVNGVALVQESLSAAGAIDGLARSVFGRWVDMVATRCTGTP